MAVHYTLCFYEIKPSYTFEARKRFLWIQGVFQSLKKNLTQPSLEDFWILYSPYEKTELFKGMTHEEIIREQESYCKNNDHLYDVLSLIESNRTFKINELSSSIGLKPEKHTVSKRMVENLTDNTYLFPFKLPVAEEDSNTLKLRIFWKYALKIPTKLNLNGGLSKFIYNQEKSSIIVNRYYHFPNFLDIVNYILVYTDFIENQYFGDILAPILKIIPVKARDNSQLVTFFDYPHYVSIKTSRINSINITLRDLQGEKIHFEDPFQFVKVKLHFKKKE